MLTTTFRRFKRDRRGVSNIVVVALSLVIILAIVSNIILWNYEMTQVDYEKMKEETTITNVQSVTEYSPWFVVQSEYSLLSGNYVEGKYVDTHAIDESFEIFVESGSGPVETVFIDGESFEFDWPPSGWSVTFDSNWEKDNYRVHDDKYSAHFYGEGGGQGWASGNLVSPVMDCSDADSVHVDFWWYDNGLDNDDFLLEFYDGNKLIDSQDLNRIESGNGWHHYQETIKDSQYFVEKLQIMWVGKTVRNGEYGCVDLVTVSKSSGASSVSLNLTGVFSFDSSEYPRETIQAVDVQLRYRANDSNGRWYLKAYNWETSEYSDFGFNNTAGHLPTTDWDIYSVNLSLWESYVHSNGTIKIQFVDQDVPDAEATRIEIDFLGVNVQMDGTELTFQNGGGLSVHVVGLWVINGTSHERYSLDVFVNSAATKSHILYGLVLPEENYVIKAVTERGNIAVYSSN